MITADLSPMPEQTSNYLWNFSSSQPALQVPVSNLKIVFRIRRLVPIRSTISAPLPSVCKQCNRLTYTMIREMYTKESEPFNLTALQCLHVQCTLSISVTNCKGYNANSLDTIDETALGDRNLSHRNWRF